MSQKYKVHAITSFADESQLNDQISILNKQKGIDLKHTIIRGLNKVQSQKSI